MTTGDEIIRRLMDEVAAIQDERDALRLAGYVVAEHLDHWCECPLPPDAGCEPCRLFSRALGVLRPTPAASQEPPHNARRNLESPAEIQVSTPPHNASSEAS